MFCSNCGIKIDDNAVFCSNCGHKIGEVQQSVKTQISPDIIIKQEPFERREFEYNVWSNYGHKKIDDGELFLYSNRLVFKATEETSIPLESITNVSVEYKFSVGYLFIKTINSGYCFMKKTKGALVTGLAVGLLAAAVLDKKSPSLEYWREEIEKQRINLLNSN